MTIRVSFQNLAIVSACSAMWLVAGPGCDLAAPDDGESMGDGDTGGDDRGDDDDGRGDDDDDDSAGGDDDDDDDDDDSGGLVPLVCVDTGSDCAQCFSEMCAEQEAACCGDAACEGAWLDFEACFVENNTGQYDIAVVLDACAATHLDPVPAAWNQWVCRVEATWDCPLGCQAAGNT